MRIENYVRGSISGLTDVWRIRLVIGCVVGLSRVELVVTKDLGVLKIPLLFSVRIIPHKDSIDELMGSSAHCVCSSS